MDLITLGLGSATIAAIPVGFVAKTFIGYGSRLTILETNHKNVDKKLDDVNAKLDRLIERFL